MNEGTELVTTTHAAVSYPLRMAFGWTGRSVGGPDMASALCPATGTDNDVRVRVRGSPAKRLSDEGRGDAVDAGR